MKKYIIGTMAFVLASTMIASPAFADSEKPAKNKNFQSGMMRQVLSFAVGKVSAISGNTLTVLGKLNINNKNSATSTFTVNAANAKVLKNTGTSTVSAIAVGDEIAVQGTINGTNVTANLIRVGIKVGPGIGFGNDKDRKYGTSTNIVGSGEPIIMGTISSIGSSTISIKNIGNVIYSVNAANAKIFQGNKTAEFSSLKIGDAVVVQGAINGTSVTASSIVDKTKPSAPKKENHPGFLVGVGQFFKHLFGF